jgi:CheY-like chemotaxis protein
MRAARAEWTTHMHSKTILLVDDEPVVLEVATRILEHAGFSVMTAGDGRQALDLCEGSVEPIDMLLTDIKMPRMNGVELAACIADHRPGVPIMFMSGDACGSDVKNLLISRPRMDGYAIVNKPFTPHQLVSAVEKLLRESAH